MLCYIDDYAITDGTLSGGFALTNLRFRMERIFDSIVLLPIVQTSGFLVVGMAYQIRLYESGDDFTNVGGTNVSGNIFIATGRIPAAWENESRLVALSPVLVDRNKRRSTISFSVQRVHSSIKAAEDFCLSHDADVPRTGDIKLIVSVYGITTSNPYALIVNGVLLSHDLIRQIGKFTEHQYNIVGSPVFPVVPSEPDHLTTEAGDRITTEGGDELIIE